MVLSPIIQMKVLLQRLWEHCLTWDEAAPIEIERVWKRWYKELPLLKNFSITRPYFPKGAVIRDVQLHGFCDASEVTYSGVVYIRAVDDQGKSHVYSHSQDKGRTLSEDDPSFGIVWRSHPRPAARHVARILEIPYSKVFAWTDSSVTLGWLQGNPRRFLAFVGNRVAEIS